METDFRQKPVLHPLLRDELRAGLEKGGLGHYFDAVHVLITEVQEKKNVVPTSDAIRLLVENLAKEQKAVEENAPRELEREIGELKRRSAASIQTDLRVLAEKVAEEKERGTPHEQILNHLKQLHAESAKEGLKALEEELKRKAAEREMIPGPRLKEIVRDALVRNKDWWLGH